MSSLLGLRTAIYAVRDIERATKWYSEMLGQEPYFVQPFYVGFKIGGFELGLDPNAALATGEAGGSVAYWGVKDAAKSYERLLELGATSHSAVQDVGDGIRVAAVLDPWGNVVGIIENPHFVE